tara:strand:+ start:2961 stop:3290 length:330 start_codon:yes stop_codon:yes gene_type:complete
MDEVSQYEETYKLDENSIAIGRHVILKIVEQDTNSKKYGDILIPDKHYINIEMLKAEVVSVGPDAKSEGLNLGDNVIYDRFAVFGKPPRTAGIFVVIDIGNIIAIIEED